MISLLTTSRPLSEGKSLIWLVRCRCSRRGIYGSIREMYGRLTPRLTYLNLFVTSSTQHRPLQLAPIGQTLRSADDHIPLLEPGFLWCLDITFRENLQYFDFLFSALKSTNLCKVKTFDMLPTRTAPNCWSSNSSWVPYHLIFIIYSL